MEAITVRLLVAAGYAPEPFAILALTWRGTAAMEEMTLKSFWQAGGFGMYWVLAFGATVLIAALRFALRPDERQIPFVRAMTATTLLTIGFAVVSDFATVFYSVPRLSENPSDWPRFMLIGSFESLTPACMGLGLLSLASLAHAIGLRRLANGLP